MLGFRVIKCGSRFKDKYLNENINFNIKLINTVAIGGIITALINLGIAISSYDSKALIGLNLFLVFFTVGIFVYTNYTQNYKKSGIMACFILNVICLPLLFIASSGIHSSIPSYFIFGIILTFILVEDRALVGMILIEVITCITTYILKFYSMKDQVEPEQLYVSTRDNLFGIIIVGLVIGSLFYIQKKMYRNQREELEKQKMMLEHSVESLSLARQEAEEAKREAEYANNLKSDFLANMSHEIRTPMNAIVGMAELITRSDINEEVRNKTRSIQHAADCLLKIINDVLDISKIESGKMEIVNGKYDTRQLFNDVVNLVSFKLEDKPIELKTYIQEDLPDQLYGDEIRIKQIIVNLLSNAIKYTHQGSITLSVTWEEIEHKARLRMSVKDTGIGIKPGDMKRLFNTFERLEIQKNHSVEGTGLGLSISKQLLEAMGGSIEVHSVYQEGSEFIIYLEQEIVSKEGVDTGEPANGFYLTEARALVIDDNEINLEVAKGLLSYYGIKTDVSLSGKEGLDLLSKTTYDLIFIDYMMPELNGIETLKRIKQNKALCKVPTVALTANTVKGMRETFLKEGFDEYLSKPINIHKLLSVLKKYLGSTMKEAPKKAIAHTEASSIQIKGIDIASMMEHLGEDSQLHQRFLEDYVKEIIKIEGLLEKYFEEDIRLFELNVHSIKGISGYIGAKEIYHQAKALEEAAKQNDKVAIREALPTFMLGLEEMLHEIRNYLDKRTEKVSEVQKDIGKLEAETLHQLYNAFDEMDIARIEDILYKVKGFSYDHETEAFIEQLMHYMEELEYTKGSEIIAQYLELRKPRPQ